MPTSRTCDACGPLACSATSITRLISWAAWAAASFVDINAAARLPTATTSTPMPVDTRAAFRLTVETVSKLIAMPTAATPVLRVI